MKKILFLFILLLVLPNVSFAQELQTSQEKVLQEQQDSLNISSFLKEAQDYTSEEFDLDVKDLMNKAIKGEVDNTTLFKQIFSLLGKEVKQSVTVLRKHSYHYYDS